MSVITRLNRIWTVLILLILFVSWILYGIGLEAQSQQQVIYSFNAADSPKYHLAQYNGTYNTDTLFINDINAELTVEITNHGNRTAFDFLCLTINCDTDHIQLDAGENATLTFSPNSKDAILPISVKTDNPADLLDFTINASVKHSMGEINLAIFLILIWSIIIIAFLVLGYSGIIVGGFQKWTYDLKRENAIILANLFATCILIFSIIL